MIRKSRYVRLCLIILSIVAGPQAGAVVSEPQDDEIRVLFIINPFFISTAQYEARRDSVKDAWANTLATPTEPVYLTVANNEDPLPLYIPLPSGATAGEAAVHLAVSVGAPNELSIRERHAADVIIYVTESIAGSTSSTMTCGFTDPENWRTGSGDFITNLDNDPLDNLDTRMRSSGYIAVVSAATGCSPGIAAHEFGHLFGGGHLNPTGSSSGLYSDSRSSWKITGWEFDGNDVHFRVTETAVGSGVDGACPLYLSLPPISLSILSCSLESRFSDPTDLIPTSRNATAVAKTAKSVANYFIGGPPVPVDVCSDGVDNDGDGLVDGQDPECVNGDENPPPPPPPPSCDATVPPYNVTGWLVQLCVPGSNPPQAHHQVVWAHSCPQEVDFYEIWYSQPVGAPFIYGWTRFIPFTDVFVWGPEGRVKVRSCGTGGCSLLSTSSYIAVDTC